MAGVNQAYRFENGDEVTMNHDSWDDSENDAKMRQNAQHQSTSESDKRMRQHLSLDSSHEAKHYGLGMMGNEGGYHQNFENCCLIQVAGGPFDDRFVADRLRRQAAQRRPLQLLTNSIA